MANPSLYAVSLEELRHWIESGIRAEFDALKAQLSGATTMVGDYLTAKEAADYLSISKSTLQRLRGKGLPHVNVGGTVRYRRCDLEAHFASQKEEDKG